MLYLLFCQHLQKSPRTAKSEGLFWFRGGYYYPWGCRRVSRSSWSRRRTVSWSMTGPSANSSSSGSMRRSSATEPSLTQMSISIVSKSSTSQMCSTLPMVIVLNVTHVTVMCARFTALQTPSGVTTNTVDACASTHVMVWNPSISFPPHFALIRGAREHRVKAKQNYRLSRNYYTNI